MGKSKFIQNSVFLVPLTKKLILLTLPLLLVMIIAGCKKNEPLSDKQVTMNLAGDWEFNKEHLLGMWKPVYFAYTKDGKKFSSEKLFYTNYTVEISSSGQSLQASLANYAFFYSPSSYFVSLTQRRYFYKGFGLQYNNLNGIQSEVAKLIESGLIYDHNNNISFAEFFADFKLNPLTYDEFQIYTVLEKAYSFIIRNDDLFIYFTGSKNENLLILKKN